jgi:hypothetical protein
MNIKKEINSVKGNEREVDAPKKSYHSPHLTVYGSLDSLTKGFKGPGSETSPQHPNSRN